MAVDVRSRANLEKGGPILHPTVAAHGGRAPDAYPTKKYCPLHGLERWRCGTWCQRQRLAFNYWAAALDEYFQRVYRSAR